MRVMGEEDAHGSDVGQAVLNGRSEDGIRLTSYSHMNGSLQPPISTDINGWGRDVRRPFLRPFLRLVRDELVNFLDGGY